MYMISAMYVRTYAEKPIYTATHQPHHVNNRDNTAHSHRHNCYFDTMEKRALQSVRSSTTNNINYIPTFYNR